MNILEEMKRVAELENRRMRAQGRYQGRTHAITPEQFKAAWEASTTQREVAAKLDVSLSFVNTHAKRLGLT